MQLELCIQTQDSAKTRDNLDLLKRWFTGVKKFAGVKVLPARVE